MIETLLTILVILGVINIILLLLKKSDSGARETLKEIQSDIIKFTSLLERDEKTMRDSFLDMEGFKISQKLTTNERGVDIIAKNDKCTLYIEAKGETSSEHTNRHEKPFSRNQIKSRISRAILASLRVLNSKPSGLETKVAIALPATSVHQEVVESVRDPFKKKT